MYYDITKDGAVGQVVGFNDHRKFSLVVKFVPETIMPHAFEDTYDVEREVAHIVAEDEVAGLVAKAHILRAAGV